MLESGHHKRFYCNNKPLTPWCHNVQVKPYNTVWFQGSFLFFYVTSHIDESVQTTKHAKSVKNRLQILRNTDVCSYDTIKLNAAFCCTTVQDAVNGLGSNCVSMQQAAVVHFQSYIIKFQSICIPDSNVVVLNGTAMLVALFVFYLYDCFTTSRRTFQTVNMRW